MAHEEFEDAIPLYAAGALDRQDRQSLEAHLLTGCAPCHAALREHQAAAALLPYALTTKAPPAALRDRVMQAALRPSAGDDLVKREASGDPPGWLRHIHPPSAMRAFQPIFAVLLLVMLIGVGTYAWFLQSEMTGVIEQRELAEVALQQALSGTTALQRDLTERDRELAELREQIKQERGEFGTLHEALRSAQMKVVSLSGLEEAKSAGALLLYDLDGKKAFFYAFNLPPLPPGTTYQLWAILDRPVSAGTFAADADSKGRMVIRKLPELSKITRFAVSLEPEGGRPQPTGAVYLAGAL
jgi:hypothetical protein